jgi:hypothetical protein
MQVDPQQHGQVIVATPEGVELPLEPGRQIVARVVDVDPGGQSARISVAGQTLNVQTDVPLHAGDTLSLTVTSTSNGQISLSPTSQLPTGQAGSSGPLPGGSHLLEQIAPRSIQALAQEGVAVTPQLARSFSAVIEQVVAQAVTPPPPAAVDALARALASLVARGIAISPAVAERVAAALSTGGSFASALSQLAAAAPTVAQTLPSTPPDATSIKSIQTPQLTNVEVALTRIALAQTAAPPEQATTASGSQLSAPKGAAPETVQAGTAAVRGESAAPTPGTVRGDALPTKGVAPPLADAKPAVIVASPPPAQPVRADVRGAALPAATAAAEATPPTVARVITQLATALARFASAVAPESAADSGAQATAKGQSTTAKQPVAGTFTPQSAGGTTAGEPAPLVAALQTALLGSRSFERGATPLPLAGSDAQQLAQVIAHTDPGRLHMALQKMTTMQTLQVAGQMLEGLPSGAVAALPGPIAAELRSLVHGSLDDLGRTLRELDGQQLAPLRSALEHVADTDPRPAVSEQARTLAHAADGSQVLSAPKHGSSDPGYAYFQLPLPNGSNAEVLVRREPSRRKIDFDHFDIAFLLNTESLGTLLVHLDAHPAGVNATVRTDRPEVEPFLKSQVEALEGPVSREAKRAVTVNVGVFENEPPTTLLDAAGHLDPGENDFYA